MVNKATAAAAAVVVAAAAAAAIGLLFHIHNQIDFNCFGKRHLETLLIYIEPIHSFRFIRSVPFAFFCLLIYLFDVVVFEKFSIMYFHLIICFCFYFVFTSSTSTTSYSYFFCSFFFSIFMFLSPQQARKRWNIKLVNGMRSAFLAVYVKIRSEQNRT